MLLKISVKNNIISHIRDYKMSKETWDTIKGLHEKVNTNQVFSSKINFLLMKLKDNDNVNNIISVIKDLKDKLSDISEKVSYVYYMPCSSRNNSYIDELIEILLQEKE